MHKTHVPFLNFRYIYLDPNSAGGINANIQWVYWILDHLRKSSYNKTQKDLI